MHPPGELHQALSLHFLLLFLSWFQCSSCPASSDYRETSPAGRVWITSSDFLQGTPVFLNALLAFSLAVTSIPKRRFSMWPRWSPFLDSLSVQFPVVTLWGPSPRRAGDVFSRVPSRSWADPSSIHPDPLLLPLGSCESRPVSPNTFQGSEAPLGLDTLGLGAFVSWDDSHPQMSHQQLKSLIWRRSALFSEMDFFRFVLLSIKHRVSGWLRVVTSVEGDLVSTSSASR